MENEETARQTFAEKVSDWLATAKEIFSQDTQQEFDEELSPEELKSWEVVAKEYIEAESEEHNPMNFFSGEDPSKYLSDAPSQPDRPEGSIIDTLQKTYRYLPYEEKIQALENVIEELSSKHEQLKNDPEYQQSEAEKKEIYSGLCKEDTSVDQPTIEEEKALQTNEDALEFYAGQQDRENSIEDDIDR